MLRDRAYRELRELFLSGRIPFEEPLSERGLAESLGMGRMPVREALRDLAKDGLVRIARGRGVFIRQFTLDEVRDAYEARQAVEGMAARLAAARGATPQLRASGERMRRLREQPGTASGLIQREGIRFHHALVEASRNRELVQIFDRLIAQMDLSLRLTVEYRPSRSWEANEEHISVLEAVERGDAAEAEARIRYSLARAMAARTQILDFLQSGLVNGHGGETSIMREVRREDHSMAGSISATASRRKTRMRGNGTRTSAPEGNADGLTADP